MSHTFEPQIGAGPVTLRPSRYWYLVALGLLAVAATCWLLAVTAVFSWDRQIQDFQRVPVPGEGAVALAQPGEYVLYVETRGTCCSWSVGDQGGPLTAWSMRLAIRPADGGPETKVSNWNGVPESYSVGGHQGLAGMTFTITHPGTYLIETSDVHPAAVTDLAVGRNIQRATLLPLMLFLAGLPALLGAVVSVVFTAVRRRQARRRLEQPPEVTGPVPWSPAGSAHGASAPVLVEFAGPARQGRWTVLLRVILAIPVLICLYFVRYVAGVILVTGWFGALFTGRLPGYAASFLAGYQRWEVRVYTYLLLLTDRYPPFGLLDADYPVSVTISPGRLNRAAVLFRPVLILPAWCITTILWYGLGPILMIPTWLIVLIRGKMPQPLHEAIAASVRYAARTKAYWYLLTDVYPDGLFGDPAEPALGGAGPAFGGAGPAATWAPPAATWAPPAAAGQAAAWAPPAGSWPEPPQSGPEPVAQPVPLPADSVVPAVALTTAAAPGRLVLSGPGKRLVGLILGVGVTTLVALFGLLFVPSASSPSAVAAPGSVVPAAAPSASTNPAPAASPAPAPSSAPSARPGGTAKWLNGLSSLSTDMTTAMGGNNQVVTSVSLRSEARRLGRCSAELAALGPPPGQLRQVHRLAVRACQGFEQGARYYAATARFMGPDGAATDQGKVTRLLDRGDAGVNRGSNLMSTAVADGSF
jgi:hypothetical protein